MCVLCLPQIEKSLFDFHAKLFVERDFTTSGVPVVELPDPQYWLCPLCVILVPSVEGMMYWWVVHSEEAVQW